MVPTPATAPSVTMGVNQEVMMSHVINVLRTATCIAIIIVDTFVLPNNLALAADGTLTNPHARQLISEAFNKQPDKLEVIGVFEQQNMAQADVVITNLFVSRPKNDAVTAYAFGPGGGSYLWSGRATANFKRYNDGKWVLVNVDTEIGQFSPRVSQASAQPPAEGRSPIGARNQAGGCNPSMVNDQPLPPIQNIGGQSVYDLDAGACRVYISKAAYRGGKVTWSGACNNSGYAEGGGIWRVYNSSGCVVTIGKSTRHNGVITDSSGVFQRRNGELFGMRGPVRPNQLPDWARELGGQ